MNNKLAYSLFLVFLLIGIVLGNFSARPQKCESADVVDNYWKLNDVFGRCILTNVELAKENIEIMEICKNGTGNGQTILHE